MESNLFRKSSLERVSSPERLNDYIKITHPGIFGVLFGCLAILIAVSLWGVYGNIPDSVNTVGVIFPQNGVTTVIPTISGRISDMRVKVGDYVEAGQIIAIVPQEELLKQIQELKSSEQPDQKLIADMISTYESCSVIVAPVSGIVLSAKAANETVSNMEAVASIVEQEKYANDKQVICYIEASAAKKLKEGMEVQVSPNFAPREEYGYMYGYITSIGSYPVSETDVLTAVGNQQYAQGLSIQGNCVEVRVTLTVDSASANKIKWSNKKGEKVTLSIGTNCNMQIIIKKYRPYELLF